ncbi:MAG: dihydroxyacetone kinase transcriptional activator DhaS [Ruminococcaceae bacterium]|nr:dihydroxyacetone kinase transcriptional activator DhaS [Oscillospiraceae bacterium]
MAESKITKMAFSEAFKDLMGIVPFQKINVGDICEKCDKNRKSFYYHFKDKYDLANISFDMDFPLLKMSTGRANVTQTVKELCSYLYDNRTYYKKLLSVEGQNSFSEYLKEELRRFFIENLNYCTTFTRSFWADAVFCSIKEWITAPKCTHYSEFSKLLLASLRIERSVS